MSSSQSPFYQQTWFEPAFIGLCFLFLFSLFYFFMPTVHLEPQSAKMIAMAKMVASGHFLDAFSQFNIPPIMPMLMGGVIKLLRLSSLISIVEAFRVANFIFVLLSVVVIYFFIRRHLDKSFAFIITGITVIAPTTISMSWELSTVAVYAFLSISTLLVVDISLSKESAMGGQLSRGEIILCGAMLAVTILSWQVGYFLLLGFFIVCWRRFGFQKGLMVLSVILLSISPFIARDIYWVVKQPKVLLSPSLELVNTVEKKGPLKTLQLYADSVTQNLTATAIGDVDLDALHATGRHSTPFGHSVNLFEKPWVRWAVSVIAVIGAVFGLVQYTGLGSMYLSIYVIATLILLPKTFGLSIAPVLPLLFFYLYYGLIHTGQWMARLEMPLLSRIAPPVLSVWILVSTLSHHIGFAKHGYLTHSHLRQGTSRVIFLSTAKPSSDRLIKAQRGTAHRRVQQWLSRTLKHGVPKNIRGQAVGSFYLKGYNPNYLVLESHNAIAQNLKEKRHDWKGLKRVYQDKPGRIEVWQMPNGHS
ncbi:MAG: hypothetical protein AAGI66_03735 [Cyanobacteria bacterium P01_H01_bin.74]